MKMGLKGTPFATMGDTDLNEMAELQKIPKEAFCQGFQQWQDQWSRVRGCAGECMHANVQGSYFEMIK
jgi:hypothetical protein